MIQKEFIGQLQEDNTLSPESIDRLRSPDHKDFFSVYWELEFILYGGVMMICSGLGTLVYKNIDTIGHIAVLAFIAVLTVSGHIYCYKHNAPFSWKKTRSSNIIFDYVLMLSAACMLIFIGYLQYQYNVFGERYGLATFIPMAILFISAYFFDHIGVLSLAIINLATWAGIAVTPQKILQEGLWNEDRLIFTAVVLGLFLLAVGFLVKKKEFKAHFEFTYKNFGTHLLFIALLSGLIIYEKYYLIWFLPLAAFTYYMYRQSIREHSFYFMLILTLYGYGGASYVLIHSLSKIPGILPVMEYLTTIYSIASALMLVRFLIKMNKKLKKQ